MGLVLKKSEEMNLMECEGIDGVKVNEMTTKYEDIFK